MVEFQDVVNCLLDVQGLREPRRIEITIMKPLPSHSRRTYVLDIRGLGVSKAIGKKKKDTVEDWTERRKKQKIKNLLLLSTKPSLTLLLPLPNPHLFQQNIPPIITLATPPPQSRPSSP